MNLLQTINDLLVAILAERGLDARACYTRVTALPPDGSTLEVECSDAAVAAELRRRFVPAGSDDVRLTVVTLPAAPLPVLVAASSVADVRRAPSHPAELVTQLVYGDAVTPLKAEGDWYLVRMDDGYIGWVRSWHLAGMSPAAREAFLARASHRVKVNHATAYAGPARDSLPVSDLVIGTPVAPAPEGRTRGWVPVELPDGKAAFVRGADLEKTPQPRAASRHRLVRTGLRFLGIPYLWGGNTPYGFDCSGLIQRIFRLNGMILPRDSDQQAGVGAPRAGRDLDALRPGDLLCFGREGSRITHVGLVLPGREFLHSYGQVRVNSLDPSHPRYEPAVAAIWRSSRDPLARPAPIG